MIIGLTGSIGMGKSTTASMFADEGVPVWDADAAVRELYMRNGAAVELVRQIAPNAIISDEVDRQKLRAAITDDPDILDKLNAAIHPLVRQNRQDFLDANKDKLVLLDVPLLFETGTADICDFVVVVSAPAEIQHKRVMERGEMTEDEFELILSRQMSDAEKRAKADQVIAALTLDETRKNVRSLIAELKQRQANA